MTMRFAAAQALHWLYGEDIHPPQDATAGGTLMAFDQTPFYTGRRLAEQGYVFIPDACREGARCALSVALHGCGMSSAQIGEAFVRDSGLNAWAAANR
ncbi:MAG: poly(3-hydroxybutyrate) depolymerase, partial [Halomonas sp.]|nr:poly(3-hydroxybutyrate) depolymerase [Halomonas sp.]